MTQDLLAQPAWLANLLFGPSIDRPLPPRVMATIRSQDQKAEILICIVQFTAIVMFSTLYVISPKAFVPGMRFEPVPIALAAYALFTAGRFVLALSGRLREWHLSLSVVADISVLMLTIWSFHIQFAMPAAIYLKAPTLLYVFIIIALRALRFDPRQVIVCGGTAAAGWLLLLAYAVWGEPMSSMITHSYAEYAMSTKVLVGAEVDKIVSIAVVTAVLALAQVRARRTLVKAVAETTASAELSRYFAPDIAATIVQAPERLEPGIGVTRNAAVMFIDLRGFTSLANHIDPTRVVALLGEYHATVLPVVQRNRGSVITYLGDGIMVTFGATATDEDAPVNAIRATTDLIGELDAWAARRAADGMPLLKAGIGVTYGPVVCGTIGSEGRLEYATIGDPVNRAARLQSLTKTERVPALIAVDAWKAAAARGYIPTCAHSERTCILAGIAEPVSVVAIS